MCQKKTGSAFPCDILSLDCTPKHSGDLEQLEYLTIGKTVWEKDPRQLSNAISIDVASI